MRTPKVISGIVTATACGLMASASTCAQAQDALGIANNDSVYIDATTFKVSPGKARGDVAAQIKKYGARELSQGAIVFRSGDKLYLLEAMPHERYAMYDPARPFAYDPGDPRRFAYDPAGRYVPERPYDQASDPRRFAYDPAGRYLPERPYDQASDPRRFAYDPAGRYAPERPYDQASDPRRFAYDPAGRYAPERPYDQASDPRRFAYDPAGRYVAERPYDQASDPRRFAYDPNDGRCTAAYGNDPRCPLINNPNGAVYVNDPDYAEYRLKKAFDENWAAVSAKQ